MLTHASRAVNNAALLDFLQQSTSEFLYLTGDIVDGPALRKAWQWEPLYNELLQTVLRKAGEGTRVVYTPGERDAGVYRLPGRRLGRGAGRLRGGAGALRAVLGATGRGF